MSKFLHCNNIGREFLIGSKKNKNIIVALNDINLEIESGKIFGLLGPNGAGKTTFIKLICGLLYPTKGNLYINNLDVMKEDKKIKKEIGVLLSNNRSMYMKLTARENLEFFYDLYGLPSTNKKLRINEVLKIVNLIDRKDSYIETFSHGMLQRLNIARTILHNPNHIILDEPTNGLDPIATNELRNTIMKLNSQGKTVLLSTHNMLEADILCDEVAIINKGSIVCQGEPSNLKKLIGKNVYIVDVFKSDVEKVIQLLKNIGINKVSVTTSSNELVGVRIITNSDQSIDDIKRTINMANIDIMSILCRDSTLEDVFISKTINN